MGAEPELLPPYSRAYWKRQYAHRDKLLKELGFTSYQDYRLSRGYQIRRSQALTRADGKCANCKEPFAGRLVEVHHRYYDRVGNERATDLVALCVDCHILAHSDAATRRRSAVATV